MADTFKFLDNKQSGGDAAQQFLNEKLSKNKYMSTSDPENPYSYGEGTTPDGTAYNPEPAPAADTKSESGGIKGSMTAEEQREKFGLTYAGEKEFTGDASSGKLHDDKGNIWYQEGGEVKYLGQVQNFKRGSTGVGGVKAEGSSNASDEGNVYGGQTEGKHTSSNALLQQAQNEREGGGPDNGFNSINDLTASLRYLRGEGEAEPEAAPAEKAKPIEHSAEIKQAKDRVQQYEQDVMSGKTSNEIYGQGEAQASDKYTFDASQGAAAIGGSPIAKADADNAAASFLNKKVADTKKSLQPISI